MTTPNTDRKYWFPAKRYWWGWGLPSAWQGWVTLASYIALLSGGAFVARPEEHPLGYGGYSFGLTALLIALCYVKGEPPGWRWGK